jgi:pimeloyl-ACP methyl ester carboxylesterase
MPYIKNRGVRIYYEVEGKGPPLVLAHGGTLGLSGWRGSGYVHALKNDYRLVMFDFRGCGRSDKPRTASAYDRKLMNEDVLTILDDLGIKKAHYFGYSGGAGTGWRLAVSHAERFHSFILGAATPYRLPEDTIRDVNYGIKEMELLHTDPEAYLKIMEQRVGHPLTPEEREMYLAQDTELLIILIKTSLETKPLSNHELARISIPCLLFCGDLDPLHAGVKESVKHMPQARFVSLPGLDHMTAAVRGDLVLPLVKEFLAGVRRK